MPNRIKYLDVAKFIGIFCIYLGHFAQEAGNAYSFVFAFHVPLFFFISGFSENLSKDLPFDKYIIKNIKNILLPCYLFAIASLLVVSIINNTHTIIIPNLINILKGCIRNQYLAGSLWFLTCLFVIKNAFYIFRKIFKFKWLTLLVCVAFYCISELFFTPRLFLIYNIDFACHYIIFYALGYYCFTPIHSLFDWENLNKKTICICIGAVLFVYSALLFFGKDLLAYININATMNSICSVLKPLFVILFVLIISKTFEDIDLFCSLGKNTLFLCGSEHLIKLFVPLCLQIIGLSITLPNPLAAYIYTFFLLVLCNKTLVVIEKIVFKKLHLIK